VKYTTLLVVDRKTLEQLEVSLPTWRLNRPEIFANPIVCAYDRELTPAELRRLWYIIGEADIKRVWWPPPGVPDSTYANQRERMLSAFLPCAAEHVETPIWMKVDTDVIALAKCAPLPMDEWFTERQCEVWGGVHDQALPIQGVPVLVGSSWGYTLNKDRRPWLSMLDDWGDAHEAFKNFPRLNIPEREGQKRVSHRRYCSWIAAYQTEFTRRVVATLDKPWKMPVPSQDSLDWFCCARWRLPWLAVSFKRHHCLTNCSKLPALVETANFVLGQTP
jgi:hypothetical protein